MSDSNTSASGGYLRPVNTPLSDVELENALQQAVVGILGFSGDLVRPRWQPTPPNQPAPEVDWCAIAIMSRTPLDYPYEHHFPTGPTRLTRWSTVTVMASLYGPNANFYAEQLRDGFYIKQNLEQLEPLGIKVYDVADVVAVPDLVNTQWVNRADVRMRFAQAVDRDYNILDLASSAGTITADTGVSTFWNTEE